MAWTQVQNKTANGTGTTLAAAFTSNVSAGSMITVAAYGWVSTPTSISDNRGNTYVVVSSGTFNTNPYKIWACMNAAAGATTVTVGGLSSGWPCAVNVAEYTGQDPSGTPTVGSSANGTGGTTSASVTVPNAGDLLIAFGFSSNNVTFSAASGFGNLIANPQSNNSLGQDDATAGSSGAQNASLNTGAGQSQTVLAVSFPALSLPNVSTQAASSVNKTTATANGSIDAIGASSPDKRGFVYDTVSRSDPGNTAPASSAYANYAEDTGTYSIGAFTKGLTGLSKNTTYYVRAYAHNSIGYDYGAEVSFTTLPGEPLVDAISDTDSGFADVTTPADTDPFESGDTVSYTVQSSLTDNTTYYWRVRAKDPSGSGTWSDWSTTRSFTTHAAAQITKTHTTSANKKKSGNTRTHTTDAYRANTPFYSKTHTTSANKKKAGNTVSHTTSANKRKAGLTVSHTTSAYKIRQFTKTHTTSANKRKAGLTRTHTADALKTSGTTTGSTTFTALSSSDDAMETGGVNTITDTIVRIDAQHTAGIRFPNITLPQGQVITGAYVRFPQYASAGGNFNGGFDGITVKGEATDNASAFTTTAGNISGRSRTTATGQNIEPYGGAYDDPAVGLNVTSIVQELLNRPGWSSGNAMAIMWIADGSTVGDYFEFYAVDYFSGFYKTQLVIQYSVPGSREFRKQHTADAYIEIPVAFPYVQHTTSAVKRKQTTKTHTTDAHTHGSAWLSKLETWEEILTQDYTIQNTGSYVELQNTAAPNYYRHHFNWDPTKWDNIDAIYFESQINTNAAATTVYVELYNVTDGVSITGSQLSTTNQTFDVTRSADIKANLPSTPKQLIIRAYTNNPGHGFVNSGRLVIQQTSGTNFRQTFALAQADSQTNTTTPTVDKWANIWLYEASKFNQVKSITMEVNAGVYGANTATFELWDLTANAAVSGTSVSTSSTTGAHLVSGDFKANLVDGHEYAHRVTNSAAGSGVGSAWGGVVIRIDQAYATKTQQIMNGIFAGLFTDTDNDGVQLDPDAYDSTYAKEFWPEITYVGNSSTGTSDVFAKDASLTEITNSRIRTDAGDTDFHRKRGSSQMPWPTVSTFYRPNDVTVVSPGAIANVWRGIINLSVKTQGTKAHTTSANKRKATTLTHTTDAYKLKVFTKSHTTSANKRKATTLTHTTSANRRKAGLTVSHTTSANKRKALTVSHTTSANRKKANNTVSNTTNALKRQGFTKTHTTDALKKIRQTLSHTTSAFLRLRPSLTHTTNAFLRRQITAFHTTDANKKRANNTVSHTTSANKRKANLTLSHTTNALKRQQFTKTHTTNALLRKQVALTHTTDTLKRKANTLSHTTDANRKKATTAFHTTDANKKKAALTVSHTTSANKRKAGLTVSHTTDALKRTLNTLTHTTSSFLRSQLTRSHTTDSYLRRGATASHTTDANKRKVTVVSHTTSSNKRKANNVVSHTTNTLIRKQGTVSHTTNALKRQRLTLTHTTNAFLRRQITLTHTTSANKRKAILVSHTTSANKKKANNLVSHTTSANKRKLTSVVHTTDALLRKLATASHTTDSFLRRRIELSHTTNANKRKLSVISHTTDAFKRGATEISHTTDANKKRANNTVNHTTDALKRVAGLTLAHTTDALKYTRNVLTHATDTLKRAQAELSHTTDSLLRGRSTLTHTTDSLKRKANAVVHTADSLLRKVGTASHTTDANKKKAGFTVSHTTSANKKKSGNTRTHTTNALKRKQFTLSHTTDANKKKQTLLTHTTNAMLRKANVVQHATDALKRLRSLVSHTTNANKKRATAVSHTTDANLKKAGLTLSHQTDAFVRGDDIAVHNTDANKRKADVVSHTTDASKYNYQTVSHTTDAVLRETLETSHTTSANKRKAGTVSHSTSAVKRTRNTVSHVTDALKRKATTVFHTTSANKRKASVVSHSTDANKRLSNNLVSHTTDSNLKTRLEVSHSTDTLKRKAHYVDHTTDANKRRGEEVSHTTSASIFAPGYVQHTTSSYLFARRGKKKVLVNGVWVYGTVMVLEGGDWVVKDLYYWTGSSWELSEQ